MNLIERFARIDQKLASGLPDWPVSLVMTLAVVVGLILAGLMIALI